MGLITRARERLPLESYRFGGSSLLGHRLTLLNGLQLDLAEQRGRPTLIVNTATQCGFASQFHGLQAVYERFRNRGLLVLACPSGDFNGLELDQPAEIADICRGYYEVKFPITEPMSVRNYPHPFWQDLAAAPGSGPPVWNFTKYLLDGDGQVRGWWSTNVRPTSTRITDAIQALLPDAQRGFTPAGSGWRGGAYS